MTVTVNAPKFALRTMDKGNNGICITHRICIDVNPKNEPFGMAGMKLSPRILTRNNFTFTSNSQTSIRC